MILITAPGRGGNPAGRSWLFDGAGKCTFALVADWI